MLIRLDEIPSNRNFNESGFPISLIGFYPSAEIRIEITFIVFISPDFLAYAKVLMRSINLSDTLP